MLLYLSAPLSTGAHIRAGLHARQLPKQAAATPTGHALSTCKTAPDSCNR
jgi:hypothetical protein